LFDKWFLDQSYSLGVILVKSNKKPIGIFNRVIFFVILIFEVICSLAFMKKFKIAIDGGLFPNLSSRIIHCCMGTRVLLLGLEEALINKLIPPLTYLFMSAKDRIDNKDFNKNFGLK
jgi:hypothetical protein